MSEKFNLKWNDFQPHIVASFSTLKTEQKFADVTLMSDDYQQVKAHKIVLATCSDYFTKVLEQNQHSHPILCLDGINKQELLKILDYVYNGEVEVPEESLQRFLHIAQKFQLQGLLTNQDSLEQTKDEFQHFDTRSDEIVTLENDMVIAKTEANLLQEKIKKTPIVLSDEFKSIDELNAKIEENIFSSDGMKCCSLCQYRSKNISHVKEHIEAHFKLNFPCPNCDKTFKTRTVLRNHNRVHKKYQIY